jgi:large subunit ribosomal protein L24
MLRAAPEGTTARGRLALTDVDVAAVAPAEPRPVVTGRIGVVMEAEGNGLSPATLIGSLRGAGTVTLEAGQIGGLDPKAFDAVIRAVDRGVTIDGTKIGDLMEAGLQSGRLTVPRVDGAFSLNAGQARWGNVIAHGDGADLTISGVVDLSQGLVDARLMLSGQPDPSTQGRPDVFIALKGPLTAPKRTVDVAAVTGWLTLRAVERQSKRLESLQSERDAIVGTTPPATTRPAEPTVQPAPPIAPGDAAEPSRPSPPPPRRALAPAAPVESAPALPPPIEIRPVPDARNPSGNPGVLQKPAPSGAAPTGAAPSGTPPTGAASSGPAKPRTSGGPKPAADGARPPSDLPPAAARRSVLDQLFGPQR